MPLAIRFFAAASASTTFPLLLFDFCFGFAGTGPWNRSGAVSSTLMSTEVEHVVNGRDVFEVTDWLMPAKVPNTVDVGGR